MGLYHNEWVVELPAVAQLCHRVKFLAHSHHGALHSSSHGDKAWRDSTWQGMSVHVSAKREHKIVYLTSVPKRSYCHLQDPACLEQTSFVFLQICFVNALVGSRLDHPGLDDWMMPRPNGSKRSFKVGVWLGLEGIVDRNGNLVHGWQCRQLQWLCSQNPNKHSNEGYAQTWERPVMHPQISDDVVDGTLTGRSSMQTKVKHTFGPPTIIW